MKTNFDKITNIVIHIEPNHVSRFKAAIELEKLMLNNIVRVLTEIQIQNTTLLLEANPTITEKEAYDRWSETAWSKNNVAQIELAYKRLVELL